MIRKLEITKLLFILVIFVGQTTPARAEWDFIPQVKNGFKRGAESLKKSPKAKGAAGLFVTGLNAVLAACGSSGSDPGGGTQQPPIQLPKPQGQLSWNCNTDPHDGYRIHQSESSGIYPRGNELMEIRHGGTCDPAQISNVPITGLTEGKQYFWIVTAIRDDDVGGVSTTVESGNSNEVSEVAPAP